MKQQINNLRGEWILLDQDVNISITVLWISSSLCKKSSGVPVVVVVIIVVVIVVVIIIVVVVYVDVVDDIDSSVGEYQHEANITNGGH